MSYGTRCTNCGNDNSKTQKLQICICARCINNKKFQTRYKEIFELCKKAIKTPARET